MRLVLFSGHHWHWGIDGCVMDLAGNEASSVFTKFFFIIYCPPPPSHTLLHSPPPPSSTQWERQSFRLPSSVLWQEPSTSGERSYSPCLHLRKCMALLTYQTKDHLTQCCEFQFICTTSAGKLRVRRYRSGASCIGSMTPTLPCNTTGTSTRQL